MSITFLDDNSFETFSEPPNSEKVKTSKKFYAIYPGQLNCFAYAFIFVLMLDNLPPPYFLVSCWE